MALFPGPSHPIEGSWDYTGEDTQYLTHGLHPYLASMIPQIAARLLKEYSDPSTRVLDPFMGGGTVLLESYLANTASTGLDINALAVIIAKAKVTPIPKRVLLWASKEFTHLYPKVDESQAPFPQSSRLDYWFKEYMFAPLRRVKETISQVAQGAPTDWREPLRVLLDCIFSNTVRDVSLTYRGEVRLRRLQGDDLERFNPDVLREFKRRMSDAFFRVGQLPVSPNSPIVLEGNAKTIPAKDGAFDLVITSPPYGDIKNTIPYHQFSKNMLYWLGIAETAIPQICNGALGARNGKKAPPRTPSLLRALDSMRKENLKCEAIWFYADYEEALREIARVTSGRIIIISGSRILDGVQIDNPSITTELLANAGWRLESKFQRSIRKKRIHRKMGFGNNAQGGTIDEEAILVYTQ